MDLVVWSGPVNKAQVPGATIEGAREHFFGCLGNVTNQPHCPTLANSWLDADGRRLPGMLRTIGLNEADVDNIYYGAYSAGGSLVKRLLMHPKDRAKVRGVMLADATYSSGGTSPNPTPIEGFTRYALDAMRGGKMLVATVSNSPNMRYGSGSEVLAATRKEIERRSGRKFSAGGELAVSDQPNTLHTLGPSVIFADYGSKGGGHGYHPRIAPEFWQNVLQPWAGGAGRPLSSAAAVFLSFAAGTAAGYALVSIADTLMRKSA